jgi:hypothetical protein
LECRVLYNHRAAARVSTTWHVVEALQRLTDVEVGSDIPRVVGVTMAYAAGHCPACCTR